MSAPRTPHLAVALALAAVLGGCADADPRMPAEHRVVAGGHAQAAPAAMREYGCNSCHTIPGVAGADALVGPPLTGFASRHFIAGRVPNTPDWLVRWIRHPQEVKPGTAMPEMGVSNQDALDIAAYLYTLR